MKAQPVKRLRTRDRDSNSDSDTAKPDQDFDLKISDVLELRKLRRKSKGVDASALGRGDPLVIKQREEAERLKRKAQADDPWKLKTGGIVDLNQIKGSKMTFGEDPTAGSNATFTPASNSMDTEKKMLEFIESELQKRRQTLGGNTDDASNESLESQNEFGSDEDTSISVNAAVAAAAGAINAAAKKPTTEGSAAFSAAMLTSIPVVDLGISAKLQNIEDTERARRGLVQKSDSVDQVDKLSGSMNVTASDRFYRGIKNKHSAPIQKSSEHIARQSNSSHNSENKSGGSSNKRFDRRTMATDDLVMDKFRKRNYPRK